MPNQRTVAPHTPRRPCILPPRQPNKVGGVRPARTVTQGGSPRPLYLFFSAVIRRFSARPPHNFLPPSDDAALYSALRRSGRPLSTPPSATANAYAHTGSAVPFSHFVSRPPRAPGGTELSSRPGCGRSALYPRRLAGRRRRNAVLRFHRFGIVILARWQCSLHIEHVQ